MWKKDDTFYKLLEFKALVDKETGKKVKALRSDSRGEYVLNEFKNYMQKKAFDES